MFHSADATPLYPVENTPDGAVVVTTLALTCSNPSYILGSTIGVIQGDGRGLDYGSSGCLRYWHPGPLPRERPEGPDSAAGRVFF